MVSHDPMCHCVVVKTAKGELTLQDDYAKFMQDYNQAKGLKVGAEVTGVYKTVNHIHYLMSIALQKDVTWIARPANRSKKGRQPPPFFCAQGARWTKILTTKTPTRMRKYAQKN